MSLVARWCSIRCTSLSTTTRWRFVTSTLPSLMTQSGNASSSQAEHQMRKVCKLRFSWWFVIFVCSELWSLAVSPQPTKPQFSCRHIQTLGPLASQELQHPCARCLKSSSWNRAVLDACGHPLLFLIMINTHNNNLQSRNLQCFNKGHEGSGYIPSTGYIFSKY